MAELQHTIGSRPDEKPLLIKIDVDCGHGGGKPTAKVSKWMRRIGALKISCRNIVLGRSRALVGGCNDCTLA